MTQFAEKPTTLLDELDARQNDVIRELDLLNERVERTLRDWTAQRDDDEQTSVPEAKQRNSSAASSDELVAN